MVHVCFGKLAEFCVCLFYVRIRNEVNSTYKLGRAHASLMIYFDPMNWTRVLKITFIEKQSVNKVCHEQSEKEECSASIVSLIWCHYEVFSSMLFNCTKKNTFQLNFHSIHCTYSCLIERFDKNKFVSNLFHTSTSYSTCICTHMCVYERRKTTRRGRGPTTFGWSIEQQTKEKLIKNIWRLNRGTNNNT